MIKIIRVFLWLGGTLILVAALLYPASRLASNLPASWISFPLATGATCLVIGSTIRGRLQNAGLWFSVALIGQAAILWLTRAGSLVGYQHLKSPGQMITDLSALALLVVIIQMIAVAIGIKQILPEIRVWLCRNIQWWQLIILLLVLTFSSAALSRQIGLYVYEVILALFLQLLSLSTILLVVWSIPQEDRMTISKRMNRLLVDTQENEVTKKNKIDMFPIIVGSLVVMASGLLSVFVYQRHPHVQDEVMYLYQARYMAEGKLSVPAPPVPEAFSFYMIPEKSDRWYSIFPPGWPAVLAIGVKLGTPWLVNPILAGINILLAYYFVRGLYDRRTARMVILLLALSPWFTFMAMNLMAHTFMLTCALVAALGMNRALKSNRIGWAAISGLAVGIASLIRPLDGALLAVLLGLWAVFSKPRLRLSSLLAFGLSGIAAGGLVLPYNQAVSGDLFTFPLSQYYADYFGPLANAFGFGPGRGLGWEIDAFTGHSLLEAAINTALNSFLINVELFGWSTGSLLLATWMVISGRMNRKDILMLVFIVGTVGVFGLYWFNGGPDFGARYWYLIILPLVVLTVRGIDLLNEQISSDPDGSRGASLPVTIAVCLLCAIALVTFFTWRAVDKYYHYLGMRPDIKSLATDYQFGKSLVLIQGNSFPDYQSAWVFNPLDPFAEQPVYALDISPEIRVRLLKAYSDRPVWLVAGPSVTQKGYSIVQGPVNAAELLSLMK